MSKVTSKVSLRNGLLPKPRKIFKQPFKHDSYVKQADTGYVGVLHPKNISRDYVPPKVFTPEQRLKKSAKEPSKTLTKEEIAKLPTAQQFKIQNAQMRRQYLEESYNSEIKRLNRIQERQELEQEEQKISDAQKLQHEQSTAELFTVPTVESYLEGPLIRPRTEEEKDQLQLKRQSNRLQAQLEVDQQRAHKLLDLYNSSSKFAITEEKLDQMVNDAFSTYVTEAQRELYTKSTWAEIDTIRYDNKLMDTIMDNVNEGPGFIQVEDSLTGFNNDIRDLAQQIQKEKNDKNMERAKEKASHFNEIKDKLNEVN